MIRIIEQHDWVIFTLLGCILILSLMLISLQREATLKEFLLQNFENSSNIFLTWGITTIVFITLLSVLISQFIPFIPNYIQDHSLFGFQLNKFGFTFLSTSIFYLLKSLLTYFYFYAVRNQKKWRKFYFIATRFYFSLTVLLFLACIQIYYFPANRLETFQTYSYIFVFIFIFKNIFYLFHNSKILPNNWYYKFLYICTLQIIPLLVLWKFLFD